MCDLPSSKLKGGVDVNNRLTVIGAKRQVRLFERSSWAKTFGGRYYELLESSSGRFMCQFVTAGSPLDRLKLLSGRWERVVLLLDFEDEQSRIKGLTKAQGGKADHCEISY